MACFEHFGAVPAGDARIFTLKSEQLRVRITNYGARMVAIEAPDRDGRFGHVLLGFDSAEAYAAAGGSFGAILGRAANRIAGGGFRLDGTDYRLEQNDPGGTLHGGPEGFARKLWAPREVTADRVVLTLTSPDGDQGFPGALTARVVYRLEGDTLLIELGAATDRPTICNLSAHPYFNLSGARRDVLDHEIAIAARRFLPTDARQIPTGERRAVAGTPFDFSAPRRLGARIREPDDQLRIGRGYDHCFVLDDGARFAASAYDPVSGRRLELTTSQPGLQLYSGNSLDGSVVGRLPDGRRGAFRQSDGFAFEAQNFPDAPNQPKFPSAVLRPGQTYRQEIAYRFSSA
jgi:aldose 1-epimerase